MSDNIEGREDDDDANVIKDRDNNCNGTEKGVMNDGNNDSLTLITTMMVIIMVLLSQHLPQVIIFYYFYCYCVC